MPRTDKEIIAERGGVLVGTSVVLMIISLWFFIALVLMKYPGLASLFFTTFMVGLGLTIVSSSYSYDTEKLFVTPLEEVKDQARDVDKLVRVLIAFYVIVIIVVSGFLIANRKTITDDKRTALLIPTGISLFSLFAILITSLNFGEILILYRKNNGITVR